MYILLLKKYNNTSILYTSITLVVNNNQRFSDKLLAYPLLKRKHTGWKARMTVKSSESFEIREWRRIEVCLHTWLVFA